MIHIIKIPNLEDELKAMSDEQIRELCERTDTAVDEAGGEISTEDLATAFTTMCSGKSESARRQEQAEL